MGVLNKNTQFSKKFLTQTRSTTVQRGYERNHLKEALFRVGRTNKDHEIEDVYKFNIQKVNEALPSGTSDQTTKRRSE